MQSEGVMKVSQIRDTMPLWAKQLGLVVKVDSYRLWVGSVYFYKEDNTIYANVDGWDSSLMARVCKSDASDDMKIRRIWDVARDLLEDELHDAGLL
jgi:hypothetical protein